MSRSLSSELRVYIFVIYIKLLQNSYKTVFLRNTKIHRVSVLKKIEEMQKNSDWKLYSDVVSRD